MRISRKGNLVINQKILLYFCDAFSVFNLMIYMIPKKISQSVIYLARVSFWQYNKNHHIIYNVTLPGDCHAALAMTKSKNPRKILYVNLKENQLKYQYNSFVNFNQFFSIYQSRPLFISISYTLVFIFIKTHLLYMIARVSFWQYNKKTPFQARFLTY